MKNPINNDLHQGVVYAVGKIMKSKYSSNVYKKYIDKYGALSTEELIREYKREDISDQDKKWLLEQIYLKMFYFFPYTITQHHYFLTAAMFDEAIQNISVALLNAIKRFNPNLGYKFAAYFFGDLKSSMRKTFRDSNLVKLPSINTQCTYFKEEDAVENDSLIPVSGHEHEDPIDSLIKEQEEKGDLHNDVVEENHDINADRVLVSKSTKFNDSYSSSEYDFDAELYKKQLSEWLEEAISKESGVLTDDERMVVILHNGLFGNKPMIYKDIAKLRKKKGRGSARSRISQIHTQALEKIKKWFMENHIFEDNDEPVIDD